jgi:ethanolamine transporter EutH
LPENQKIVVMGFVAGLIALPLGLIVGIIITVIYYSKKNRNNKELSTTKMVFSSLGVFFISTLIAIPSVFYLLFLMYSAAT